MTSHGNTEPLLATAGGRESLQRDGFKLLCSSSKVRHAMLNTLKSVFGTGLLAMPFAFVHVGILQGCVLTCIVGAWSLLTMWLLSKSAELLEGQLVSEQQLRAANIDDDAVKAPRDPYGKLVHAALGPNIGLVCTANLIAHQVLCCAAYVVFLGDNMASALGLGSAQLFSLCAAPVFVLLTWLPDLRRLSPVSAAGTAVLALVLVAVLVDGAAGLRRGGSGGGRANLGVGSVPSTAGTAVFTFAGHSETLAVAHELDRHSEYTLIIGAVAAIGIPAVCGYSATAAALFGCSARHNVLLSLDSRFASALKIAISFVALFSMPLKMFPAVQAVECSLFDGASPLPWSRRATRTALCALTLAAALLMPDFGFLVAFIGAFNMGIIALVLPPMVFVVLARRAPGANRRLAGLCIVLTLLGVCVTARATFRVVYSKLEAPAHTGG